MSINDIENLFLFAGGLGMFLFGMHSMSDGIQKSTGSKMQELLGILTNKQTGCYSGGSADHSDYSE